MPPAEAWEALPILEEAEYHNMPILGGTLDQAAAFLDLLGQYRSTLACLGIQSRG